MSSARWLSGAPATKNSVLAAEENDDCGAHVGLGDNQSADDAQQKHERHETERELVDVLAAAGQPSGDIDNDCQLRELAWLERDGTEDQPAGRAVALHAYPRHQHEDQAHERKEQHRHAPSAQPVVVHSHEEDERAHSEEREHSLPGHEVVSVAIFTVANGEAGGVHGEETGDDEHGGRRKQHVVGRSRAEGAGPPVFPVEI